MSSSLPDGFSVRAATLADADAIASTANAAETAIRGSSDFTGADLREEWRTVDLTRDTWLVEHDGRVAAAATMWRRSALPIVWGDVHPEYAGRGLDIALAELTETRARDLAVSALRRETFAEDERLHALLTERGYREVRRHFAMRVDLGDEPPPEPELPDGLVIDTFRLHDARAFHGALNEAFQDEWGWAPMPYEEWRATRVDAAGVDHSVWFVVRDRSELAAVIRNDPHLYGGGWVGALGVRPAWRRRGLGLALLLHTFREFHARGVRRVGLGVDTENPTGATRLYERAGMYVELELIQYEKQLRE